LITDQLADLLRTAVQSAHAAGDLNIDGQSFDINLEPPNQKQFGDFASNIALVLQKPSGLQGREVAARIVKHLPVGTSLIDRVEIAGPGFMNFYLKPTWLHDTLVKVDEQDAAYGTNDSRKGERTLIEFVSANPTGPISVVNGRAAVLGDSLANLLKASGAEVSKEFYINDALNSTQIDKLGESLAMRYLEQLGHTIDFPEEDGEDQLVYSGKACVQCGEYHAFPKDGYYGDYLSDISRQIVTEAGKDYEALSPADRAAKFRELAPVRMIAQQKSDLEAFGVEFDTWFYESSLYAAGKVRAAIDEMKARGYAYEKEGALWLKTTALSKDEKDRVLVRSTDKETYIAADAAYHKDKFDRGFNRLIDIWGADHHGYVERLKAGVAALGNDPAKCEIILTQMVLLVRNGEPVRGGKRTGNIIPLIELINEVGRDAARFYNVLNSYETTAVFDLDLAKKQSSDNPVWYAQYAHARCANVLRKAAEKGVALVAASQVKRELLTHEKELDLLRKLADYPGEVKAAADLIAPHRLTSYVREIGQTLHQFYEECPALREDVPTDLRDARLSLFNATRIVVRNLLGLLGVTALEQM
jgi:arginyl-tRNA synthetase